MAVDMYQYIQGSRGWFLFREEIDASYVFTELVERFTTWIVLGYILGADLFEQEISGSTWVRLVVELSIKDSPYTIIPRPELYARV